MLWPLVKVELVVAPLGEIPVRRNKAQQNNTINLLLHSGLYGGDNRCPVSFFNI
jgi:hypothetical protein